MAIDEIHPQRRPVRGLVVLGIAGIVALLLVLGPRWLRERDTPGIAVATTRPAARLIVPGGEARFRQWQRTSQALPGGEKVLLRIGDVTGRKVKASVALSEGETIAQERAVAEGDELRFELDGRNYVIVVEELRNALIGEDEVVFVLREVDGQPQAALTEDQKIQRLIEAVNSLQGATFIRNGGEHSTAEAVEHMKRKWENGKGKIRTAQEFITHAASRSSLSGEAYRIRFADGTEMTSEAFLMKKLQEMENTGPATRAVKATE